MQRFTATLLLVPAAGREAQLVDRLSNRTHDRPTIWQVVAQLPKYAPGGQPLATRVSRCRALVDVSAGSGLAVEKLAAAQFEAVASLVDRAASEALVATPFTPMPGGGAAVAQACVHRRSDLTPTDFSSYWRNKHAPLAAAVEGATGYEQLHVDRARTASLAARVGCTAATFDGIGRLYFADLDAMSRARAAPEIRRDATADEMRFVDHRLSEVTALSAVGLPPAPVCCG